MCTRVNIPILCKVFVLGKSLLNLTWAHSSHAEYVLRPLDSEKVAYQVLLQLENEVKAIGTQEPKGQGTTISDPRFDRDIPLDSEKEMRPGGWQGQPPEGTW